MLVPTICRRCPATSLRLIAAVAVLFAPLLVAGQERADEPAESTAKEAEAFSSDVRQLWSEAQRLDKERKLDEAIAAGERALAATRALRGADHPDLVTALDWLAARYERKENFAAAERARTEILAIETRLKGDSHWKVVNARLALEDDKRLASFSPEHRQRLRLAMRKELDSQQRMREGNYTDALAATKESLEIRKSIFGPKHRTTAITLNTLGAIHFARGEYTLAEPVIREALDIKREVCGPEHPSTATSMASLGNLYLRMGDYARAEPLLSQAYGIHSKSYGVEDRNTASTMTLLANLYVITKQYQRAAVLYHTALEVNGKLLGPDHASTTTNLTNLGNLYRTMGAYALAEPLLQQALDAKKRTAGDNHPHTASAMVNLAELYHVKGDVAKAEPLYVSAMAIQEKALGTDHPSYLLTQARLAELFITRRQFDRAEPMLRSSLESRLKSLDAAAVTQSERQQLAATAQARSRLGAYIYLAIGAPQFQETAYRYVLAWKGSVFARQMAIRAARSNPELQATCDELQLVSSRLSAIALDDVSSQARADWQRQVSALSEKKERLEALLAEKSAKYREARQATTLESLRAALPSDAVLVDFLESVAPVESTPPATKSTGVSALTGASSRRTQAQPRLLAFLVRRDGPVQVLVLDDPKDVQKRIDAWRSVEAFESQKLLGQMTATARSAGDWLREHLWLPIEASLPPETKTVLISPDGALARLPLAALPGRQPGAYLLEDWPIAVIPAPQVLPAQLAAQTAPAEGRLLLLNALHLGLPAPRDPLAADSPQFRAANKVLQELFSHEFDSLKDMYQKRFTSTGLTALTVTSATEFAFRQHAPRNRLLHIAAHGAHATPFQRALERPAFDETLVNEKELKSSQSLADYHPSLLTAIALAPSSRTSTDPYNDGMLTAEEIQTLDLRAADFVFLFSCEAALGADKLGESMFGMQRAFHVAGARTVVAALWPVQVRASNDLAERFYDNAWNKRMDKLTALREAQLWMLRERGVNDVLPPATAAKASASGQPSRLPPLFWAGFTLSGDWRGKLVGGVER